MGPQEPHPLTRLLELRVEVPHQCDEGPRATVGSNDRRSIRASKRVLRMVADSPSKEASVKVKQVYVTQPEKRQSLVVSSNEMMGTYSFPLWLEQYASAELT